ncbi:F-box/LRR-repeat protein [Tripterygium wilfordii]|uniref:F-box/LRR-repeat protein n=1 Tax=Tripterygium wilfordii TaxID=458696 RepID=A0A7J7BYG5_TRIWF|nr:F-box/LRR-repeat protein [Tripterygium wilfordii]
MYRFRLGITRLDTELGFHINDWVSLALQNNVKQLLLKISLSYYDRKFHVLSAENLFASKSLNVLELIGCKLELPRFNHSTLCPLQKLHLSDVYLDEDTMENIRRSCPLITTFSLSNAWGLKYLHISGLHNLQNVKVILYSHDVDLEKVYIKAPRLRTFEFRTKRRHCTFDVDI